MSQQGSLGGDIVKLTISKIITAGIALVNAMLLSRFRTLDEYGTYSQLLLVVSLLSALFMLGLPNSINYFLARAETQAERKKFLSVYYTFSTVLSLVMGAMLVCTVPLITAYFKNPLIRDFFYFLAVYPWASVISSSVGNVLVVYHQTNFLLVYRIVNSVCLLGIILLVQIMGWGFRAYMLLFVGVYAAFAISVYFIAANLGGGLAVSFDRSMIWAILVFSVPMGLAAVVGTLDVEIDKLLIGRLMDTAQLAIYTNASKELPVTMIASSITAVLLPQLTRMLKHNDNPDAVRLWGYATELSFICICFLVAGVFTYAKDAVTLLYSKKYLPGVSVFRVYSLVLVLRCTYFGMILNAIGKTKEIFYCSVASLVLNAILNPLFYLLFGMVGPAIATFLSISVIQMGQLKLTANYVCVPFKMIFPWIRLGRILLVNMLFAFCFAALKQILPLERWTGEVTESLLLGCVWGILYFAIMHRTIKRSWIGLNIEGTTYKEVAR